jgi:hypothetical protein
MGAGDRAADCGAAEIDISGSYSIISLIQAEIVIPDHEQMNG